MKHLISVILTLLAGAATAFPQLITIEECMEKACANYPLIKKYSLVEAASEIDLQEINKGWLPAAGIYTQATLQNAVPSFPKALSGVMQQMGQELKGLGKLQYKIGIDVSQKIWDGGISGARRKVVKANEELGKASLDVEIYAVRRKVQNLYFAILLIEKQMEQSNTSLEILQSNLDKLTSMYRNGVAMKCDVDMVEARILSVSQTMIQAEYAKTGYMAALELLVGEPLGDRRLELPSEDISYDSSNQRPRLALFEKMLEANEASRTLSQKTLLPVVGFFAQAYYGYPGFNYFQSMLNRKLSFNVMGGVKLSWNLDSFYMKNTNSARHDNQASSIEADRDLFNFNTDVEAASEREAIEGIRKVMKDDDRIISLRSDVRKAAESQLENGVIDADALLWKISEESMARLSAEMHRIQLIQEIYNLKYTLNQ